MGIGSWDSGFCLWRPVWDFASGHLGIKHRLALNCVCSFLGQFITGTSSWDSGFCLWASGEQKLLSELCMQFQVNSLHGSVHGIWDVASGRLGIKHCSALNCVCSFGSIHYRDRFTGFGVLPQSVRVAPLNCVCSFRSIHYRDWLKGFGISPMGVRGSNTVQQQSVYAFSFQFITGLVHRIRFLPLGIRGANTALHGSVYTVSCKFITVKLR
jgi:hypothetical protein